MSEISSYQIEREKKNVKPETLFSKDVLFDTPKKLNRSEEKVTVDVIDEIEKGGVSIERLESLGLPVYKYKTQITIHGDFEGITKSRVGVGGYKNLLLNQNNSLGVKYNAIDAEKKKIIGDCLRLFRKYDNDAYRNRAFKIQFDSQGYAVVMDTITSNDDDYKEKLHKVKGIYTQIPDIFIGTKDVWSFNLPFMGVKVVELYIKLNAIRQKNLWQFIDVLTNGFISSEAIYERYQKKEAGEYVVAEEKRKAESDKRKAEFDVKKEEFKKSISFPVMTELPTTDTFAFGHVSVGEDQNPEFKVYYVHKARMGKQLYYIQTFKTLDSVITSIDTIAYHPRREFKGLKESLLKKIDSGAYYLLNQAGNSKRPSPSIKKEVIETKPVVVEKKPTYPSDTKILESTDIYDFILTQHTKTGDDIYVIKLKQDVLNFAKLKDNISLVRGYYSSFVKGFIVKSRLSKAEVDRLFEGVETKPKGEGVDIQKEIQDIAEHSNVPVEEVQAEFNKGIAVESEHVDTVEKIMEGVVTKEEAIQSIVLDHLRETQKSATQYYDKLEEVEKELEAESKIDVVTEKVLTPPQEDELSILQDRLDSLHELLVKDPNNEDTKDRIELLEEMLIEAKTKKMEEGGGFEKELDYNRVPTTSLASLGSGWVEELDAFTCKPVHTDTFNKKPSLSVRNPIKSLGGKTSNLDNTNVRQKIELSNMLYGGEIPSAPNYDLLPKAKELIKNHSAEEVWRQTGWIFNKNDGKWRFEINDIDSNLILGINNLVDNLSSLDKYKYKLSDILDHKSLYLYYPESKDIIFALRTAPRQEQVLLGSAYTNLDKKFVIELTINLEKHEIIRGNTSVRQRLDATSKSICIHELQHFLQARNDFRRAISYEECLQQVRSIVRDARAEANSIIVDAEKKRDLLIYADECQLNEEYIAYYSYRNQSAEKEARNVQERMDYSELDRSTTPPYPFIDYTMEEGGIVVGDKRAYLMTLEEYQKTVTPILLEYNKFIRKNFEKYLVKSDYNGIYYYTFEEAMADTESGVMATRRGARFSKTKFGHMESSDEAVRSDWAYYKIGKWDKEFVPEPTPAGLLEQKNEFINKLKKYFTDEEIYHQIEKDETKSNKRTIRRAIENDTYKKLLKDGLVKIEDIEKVALSVGVKLPKKLYDESVLIRQKVNQEISASIPPVNKAVMDRLISDIEESFKPLEKIVYDRETERYISLMEKVIAQDEIESTSHFVGNIPFFLDIFNVGNQTRRKGKGHDKWGREVEVSLLYLSQLSLKPNWKDVLHKYLIDYIEQLKWKMIGAILSNFTQINLPIKGFKQLVLRVGAKGFEGEYKFEFENGSSFDFKTEAIGAGGYNIQVYHFRYLSNFTNAILSDGTKLSPVSYSDIINNFSDKKKLEADTNPYTAVKNSTELIEVASAVYKYLKSKPYNYNNVRVNEGKEDWSVTFKDTNINRSRGLYLKKNIPIDDNKAKTYLMLESSGVTKPENFSA